MIDRNTIKDKGIIEQYLLGELSDDQCKAVENILKEDAELQKYVNEIESDFEKLAFDNTIIPPSHIKTALITGSAGNNIDQNLNLNSKNNLKTVYLAIAASLAALFMISTGWLYLQWQDSKITLKIVQNQTTNLQDRITVLEKNIKETNDWYQAINNAYVKQLQLKGNQISPNSKAITYVNHKDKTIILNPQGLEKLGADQTYQMWADVEGKMIDMGVIPTDRKMILMKYIDNTESINITIEPAGGNDHPTVERLISNVIL